MSERVRPNLGDGWTMWPHVLVRGAGFPFRILDEVFRAADSQQALIRIAADPRFREAVAWQNRPAVEHGLDWLIRHKMDPMDAKLRQKLLLVGKYLQRYCAKNDTIGFFGPLGWATVGGAPQYLPGSNLIAARATFFEPWAILSLARAVATGATRLQAPVSLPGHLRLNGQQVIGPERTIPLHADELRLVSAARGQSAAELLDTLSRVPDIRLRWQELLERLVAAGILRWEIPVAVSLEPERHWRAIATSEDLEALRNHRAAVTCAAGDPTALIEALQKLESEFETRTGVGAWRSGGRTYAGRGLIFEECRRAITLDLGTAPIAHVAPALRILLRIARWYTFSIATHLAQALRQEFVKLGSRPLGLQQFWVHTAPLFDGRPPSVGVVAEALRQSMSRLWSLAQGDSRTQHLDLETADSFVGQHLQAPCPGWPGARHHAPDLMWQAPNAEAMLRGEGLPILAELHPGVTPFTTLSVLSLCPVRDELAAEWRTDFPLPLVSPIPWEDFARSTQDARLAARHLHLDIGQSYVSERSEQEVLRAADFDVVSRGHRLAAVSHQTGLELDLLSVFERRIKLRAAVEFSLSDGLATGARRYLGPLLVQRANWRITELPFLNQRSGRLAAVQAWRESLQIPERVFMRSPKEVKPIYVDFRSELSVEMLVRFARQAPHISFSEMLPDSSGLWLRDASGDSYTSELRFIAVDPQPFDGATVWAANPLE